MNAAIDFKTAFVALEDERGQAATVHPTVDQLIACRRGELPAAEQNRLREHLPDCRHCFALDADLAAFADAARGAAPAPEFATMASWRALRPRLRRRFVTHRFALPATLAASLVLTVAGFSWSTASHKRTIAELGKPRANPLIVDLVAGEERTGAAALPPAIPADAGALLVFTPDLVGDETDDDGTDYEVRILDPRGTVVGTVRGLLRNSESETFTLWLPAGFLPAGDYRFELYGGRGASRLIAHHALRMVDSPAVPRSAVPR